MRLMFSASLLLGVMLATPVLAQSTTNLTCKDIDIPLSGIPKDASIAISISPDDLIRQCASDAPGDLVVISPTDGITVSTRPGGTEEATFTVRDSLGNEASAKVKVRRNE